MAELYRRYGEDRYDGALFILPEEPTNRSTLLQRLHELFPSKFIEVATIPEVEFADRFDSFFDDFQTDYPGPTIIIERNSDDYYAAVEAIDAVAARLASSNTTGLKADVRDRLLVEVKAGRTLLDATTVRIAALGNTIVPALKFIAENCAKVAIGELAKEALTALAKLLFS